VGSEPVFGFRALSECVGDARSDSSAYPGERVRIVRRQNYGFARNVSAAVEEAEAFGLPLGAYVVHIVHTATDENGDALEVSESIWPADRLAFIDEYDIPAEADPDALKSDI
jgi:DNA-binding GntR family transcriptional regulator